MIGSSFLNTNCVTCVLIPTFFSAGLNASQRQNLGETKARKASEELKRKMSQSLGGSDQAPESEPSSKRKSSDGEDLSRLVAFHHMLSER